jgi:TRAP-type C4-dicarboxylate transport system substrate-binding protein
VVTALTAACAAALVACGGGAVGTADKAGGLRASRVLRLVAVDARDDQPEAALLQWFADRVAHLSGGSLRVQVAFNEGYPDADMPIPPDAEQRIVRSVRAGTADLGWTATRSWDELGVNGFRALQSPLLVDSYALMDAIAGGPLGRKLLAGVHRAGVVGLALVPGTLRHPAGVTRRLVTPQHFVGARIQVARSRLTDALLVALGATPLHVGLFSRADGGLNSLLRTGSTTITANVVLYARMSTLIANPSALASLDARQRAAVSSAAPELVVHAEESTPSEQASVDALCRNRAGAVVTAPAHAVAAIMRAAQPITSELRHDPETRGIAREVARLKSAMPAPPALRVPRGCDKRGIPIQAAARPAAPILNGTYHWRLTKAMALAWGNDPNDESVGAVSAIVLQDGKWQLLVGERDHGTYRIDGERITFIWPRVDDVLSFRFTRDRDGTLRLNPVLPMDRGDQFVWSAAPWRRVGPPATDLH